MVVSEILVLFLASLVGDSLQAIDVAKQNYDQKVDGVVELTQKNFKTLVLNSGSGWLVIFEFSGEKCQYCIELSVIVKKGVQLLKRRGINVGFVDFMNIEGKKLIDSYGITKFPAVYIFGKEKDFPVKYPYTPRSAEELTNDVEFLMNRPLAAEGQCGKDTVLSKKSAIYELTDENFDEVVLKCDDPWIVNFYVPHAELCVQFIPHFEAVAMDFKGRVKFGSFYQMGSKVADKYKALYYCTVKFFPAGNKNRPPLDYNNGTHSVEINANLAPWLKNALAGSLPPPGINELNSQSVLETKCKNAGVVSCIFYFLQKDEKCNADCKSNSVTQLAKVANDFRGENWAWFWTVQDKQPEFEQRFGMTVFPGAFGVEIKSNSYSVLRGVASPTKFRDFVQTLAREIHPSKDMPPGGFPSVRNN